MFWRYGHDCMIAHGVSHLLSERPLCQNDAYRAHFCVLWCNCNNEFEDFFILDCRGCKNNIDIV